MHDDEVDVAGVDLSGLAESMVDSDDEEGYAESHEVKIRLHNLGNYLSIS